VTHKVYLIRHLDNGKQYVGITGGDLAKRWQQHYNDPKSAVYKALRKEGYRMTMELLDEVDDRDDALLLEQMYIQTLNTAEPHGWNRMVRNDWLENVKSRVTWKKIETGLSFDDFGPDMNLLCPTCNEAYMHMKCFEIYQHHWDKGYKPWAMLVTDRNAWAEIEDPDVTKEAPGNHDGPSLRIRFECESCHNVKFPPPAYSINIYDTHGNTHFFLESFVKDNK